MNVYYTNFNKYLYLNIFFTIFVITSSLILYILPFSYEIRLLLYSWLGNLILILGIVTFKGIKETHINPYTLFFISYYLFSYGQQLLYSIGIEYERFNLLQIYPDESIILYSLFFCVGTSFMLLGGITAIKKDIITPEKLLYNTHDVAALNNAVKIVAWSMFILSSPIYLYNKITSLFKSIQYGYGSLYEDIDSSPINNLIDSLGMFFITSIILLLVVYKSNKFIRTLILMLVLFLIFSSFTMGGRSAGMALIASFIFIWYSEIKKITKKDKVILLLGMLMVFSLLPVIQSFRGSEFKTFGDFMVVFQTMYKDNLFVKLIGELGSSIHPWLLTHELIPNYYSFKLGESYIASIFAVIPSILLGGYSFTENARLSGWLMDVNNMSYGPGFSILAETYYNFGWFGIPFMFIIGWFIFKLLSNNMFKGIINLYKNAFSAVALYIFITIARSSIYLGFRNEIYSIILPIIVIMIIYTSIKQKSGAS